MLDELVGSHTRLAIILPSQSTTKGLLSVPHSILGSGGEGSDLPGFLQITKVVLTKVLQQSLDAYI